MCNSDEALPVRSIQLKKIWMKTHDIHDNTKLMQETRTIPFLHIYPSFFLLAMSKKTIYYYLPELLIVIKFKLLIALRSSKGYIS